MGRCSVLTSSFYGHPGKGEKGRREWFSGRSGNKVKITNASREREKREGGVPGDAVKEICLKRKKGREGKKEKILLVLPF